MEYHSKARFDNYRRITARFRGSCSSCGNVFPVGESIGYNRLNRNAQCDTCFSRWEAENREAAAYEATGFDCSYDF